MQQPVGVALGSMRWRNTLFVHWRVAPAELEYLVPPGLRLDLHAGDAYLTLVAVGAEGPVSRRLRYQQVILRSYVVGHDRRGVLVIDTQVDRRLPALGARLLGMPYRVVRPLSFSVDAGIVSLVTPELGVAGRVLLVVPTHPQEGTLEHFLVERRWTFARLPGGVTYAVRIAHAPWRLRPIAVTEAPSLGGLGFDETDPPCAAHLAEDLEVSITDVERVRDGDEWIVSPLEAPA